jgi:hypothetical protein
MGWVIGRNVLFVKEKSKGSRKTKNPYHGIKLVFELGKRQMDR